MVNRRLFGLLLLVALLPGCDPKPAAPPLQYSASPVGTALPTYRFAVHPLHNPVKLSEAYQPLIDRLNQALPEVRFELEASRDYQAYERKFRARGPDILLPNPWQSIEAMKVGYRVIATAGKDEDFKGIFIARKNSGIGKVADIRGKTVSYPSHTALAACIMPQYFLHRQGIDIKRDIRNAYVGSQESAIMNVYLGKSALGATWPPPWRLFQRDHPAEAAELEVLWETPSLINNAVMVRDDLPPAIVHKLSEVLFALADSAEGRAILDGMSTAAFHPADDARYRQVTEFIARFEKEVRAVEEK
jgi:phosphonate transport system substrate-binding protein